MPGLWDAWLMARAPAPMAVIRPPARRPRRNSAVPLAATAGKPGPGVGGGGSSVCGVDGGASLGLDGGGEMSAAGSSDSAEGRMI
ncbi:hypothetical protein BW737_008025 [Actinomyces ruminis]|uniref:Uncharacterized protein n=1 Tax=Actinomyces ruminis TaxID=1937003 RepID=A0ABX4MF84_9ACTO|nr:hypothetical protein BW737_008025 [Actinomyces ruminis]